MTAPLIIWVGGIITAVAGVPMLFAIIIRNGRRNAA